jgi:hypothetical protein
MYVSFSHLSRTTLVIYRFVFRGFQWHDVNMQHGRER